MSNDAYFKDKVCVITGGAGSLGLASARLFLAEGAKVMLVDLGEADLERSVRDLASPNVDAVASDVSDATATRAYIERTVSRFGPIDASVVTAAVAARRNLRYRAGIGRALARRFGPVDAIVHGHWHEPVAARAGGVLLYSPGAVCPWGSLEGGRAPRPGAKGVADRAVRRFRTQLGPEAMRPMERGVTW